MRIRVARVGSRALRRRGRCAWPCQRPRRRTPTSLRTVAVGERRRQHPAGAGLAHLRRGGRAALRDHLGDRRGRPPGDGGPAATIAHAIRTRSSSRCSGSPEGWYLVYWRVISVDGHPVRGAFTFAVGPNPGPQPQFVDPVDRRDRGDAAARRGAVGRVPLGDVRDRALRVAHRASPGRSSAASTGRACAPSRSRSPLLPPSAWSRLRSTSTSRPRSSRFARRSTSARSCRSCTPPRSGAAISTSSSASRSSWPPPAWPSGSTGPSGRCARSPSCSRPARRGAAARAVLLVPGAAGHAAQTAPRGVSLASRLAPPRRGLGLGRRPRRPARALALPAGRAARRGPRRRRARASRTPRSSSVLAAARHGYRRDRDPHADARRALADLVRQGDPRQGRRCSPARCCSPPSTSSRTKPRLAAARQRLELGAARPRPAAPARRRRGRPRRGRGRRRRGALEPRPAAEGARAGRRCARPRRSRVRVAHTVTRSGYTLKVLRRPEPRCRAERFRAARSPAPGSRSTGADVTVTFAMLDMEMGNAGVPPRPRRARASTRGLRLLRS